MTLRLEAELDKQLTQLAEAMGLSKQQVAEQAIDRFIELEFKKRVARHIVDQVLVRDAEALRRLADA
ncbi:MAG: hypothetical protein RL508_622 [Actinomycetota bacterium]